MGTQSRAIFYVHLIERPTDTSRIPFLYSQCISATWGTDADAHFETRDGEQLQGMKMARIGGLWPS